MPPVEFEPTILSRRTAADLRLRPCGYWQRHICIQAPQNVIIYVLLPIYLYIKIMHRNAHKIKCIQIFSCKVTFG